MSATPSLHAPATCAGAAPAPPGGLPLHRGPLRQAAGAQDVPPAARHAQRGRGGGSPACLAGGAGPHCCGRHSGQPPRVAAHAPPPRLAAAGGSHSSQGSLARCRGVAAVQGGLLVDVACSAAWTVLPRLVSMRMNTSGSFQHNTRVRQQSSEQVSTVRCRYCPLLAAAQDLYCHVLYNASRLSHAPPPGPFPYSRVGAQALLNPLPYLYPSIAPLSSHKHPFDCHRCIGFQPALLRRMHTRIDPFPLSQPLRLLCQAAKPSMDKRIHVNPQ